MWASEVVEVSGDMHEEADQGAEREAWGSQDSQPEGVGMWGAGDPGPTKNTCHLCLGSLGERYLHPLTPQLLSHDSAFLSAFPIKGLCSNWDTSETKGDY